MRVDELGRVWYRPAELYAMGIKHSRIQYYAMDGRVVRHGPPNAVEYHVTDMPALLKQRKPKKGKSDQQIKVEKEAVFYAQGVELQGLINTAIRARRGL